MLRKERPHFLRFVSKPVSLNKECPEICDGAIKVGERVTLSCRSTKTEVTVENATIRFISYKRTCES